MSLPAYLKLNHKPGASSIALSGRPFYDSREYLHGGPETRAQVQRRHGHRHQSLLASPFNNTDGLHRVKCRLWTNGQHTAIHRSAAQRNSGLLHCNGRLRRPRDRPPGQGNLTVGCSRANGNIGALEWRNSRRGCTCAFEPDSQSAPGSLHTDGFHQIPGTCKLLDHTGLPFLEASERLRPPSSARA